MGISSLLTEFASHTYSALAFEVGGRRDLLPELPPLGSRSADLSRVGDKLMAFDVADRKFRVLLDGGFTGIEFELPEITDCVRVVFRVERDGAVLCVDGVPEIPGYSDAYNRMRIFGSKRNSKWDLRKHKEIARSDSESATKLRNKEGKCKHLAPFVASKERDENVAPSLDSEKRYASSPMESPQINTLDRKYEEDEKNGPPVEGPTDNSKKIMTRTRRRSAKVSDQQEGSRDVTRLGPLVQPRRRTNINNGENTPPRPSEPVPPRSINSMRPKIPEGVDGQVGSRDDTSPLNPLLQSGRQISTDREENLTDNKNNGSIKIVQRRENVEVENQLVGPGGATWGLPVEENGPRPNYAKTARRRRRRATNEVRNYNVLCGCFNSFVVHK